MNTFFIKKQKTTLLSTLLLALSMLMLSGCLVLGDEPLLREKPVHNTHLLGQWQGDDMLLTITKANHGKMQILISTSDIETTSHSILEASTDTENKAGFISIRHTDGMFGDALDNRYVHGYFQIEKDELSYHNLNDSFLKQAIKKGKIAGSEINKDGIYLKGSAKKIRQVLEKEMVDDFTEDTTYFKRMGTQPQADISQRTEQQPQKAAK